MRQLARRLLHSMLSLIAISMLCFALLRAAPGDYYSELRLEPGLSPQALAAMDGQSDLKKPIAERYAIWCKAALQGDLGMSLLYHLPVAELLKERIANTLLLTGLGLSGAWIVGLLFGATTGWLATVVRAWAAVLWSIPEPILALLLLLGAVRLHALAPLVEDLSRAASPWDRTQSLAQRIALPALAMTLGYLPVVLRHVQRGFDAARRAPAVEAAQAHGFSPQRILLSYVLPEAATPLISLFGLGVGSMLSASLFVEVLFGWPGLGQLLLNAILARDTNIVVAGVLGSALMLIAGNLLGDILLWLHDPRLRGVTG